MGFFLDEKVLYKKSKDQILLRCVDAKEAKKIIHEIHEGVCGTHASGHVMARQIMRARYYWMTLENDCINTSENAISVKSMRTRYMSHLCL